MEALDDIINQSFNDDLARYNNKPIQINSNDKTGIIKIFKNLGGLKDDCNICYENCKCIQCYQCSFKYCQDCLIKVVSEFTKCSSCNVEFKNNTQKIEDFNKKLIEKEKEKNKKINNTKNIQNTKNIRNSKNIQNSKNSGFNSNYLDNYLGDYALDDDYPDYIDYDYNHKNSSQNKNSNGGSSSSSNSGSSNGNIALDDLDDLDDFEREQISILLENIHLTQNQHAQPAIPQAAAAISQASINRIIINPPSQNGSGNLSMIQPSFEQFQTPDNYLETCFKARTNCNIPDIKYDCRLITIDFQSKLSIYLSTLTQEPRKFNLKWIKISSLVNIFVIKQLAKCNYDPSNIKSKDKDKCTVKILKKIEKIVLE